MRCQCVLIVFASFVPLILVAIVILHSFVALAPRAGGPQLVLVEGYTGENEGIINGEYELKARRHCGQPVWERRIGIEASYLLYEVQCPGGGRWLVTSHPQGKSSQLAKEFCHGWASVYATSPLNPWSFVGWQSGSDGTQGRNLSDMHAIPVRGIYSSSGSCSRGEESALVAVVKDIDLVIFWVNGSDPEWIRARSQVCRDFSQRLWPDAVARSTKARACMERANGSVVDGDRAETCHSVDDILCRESGGANINKFTADQLKCFDQFVEQFCTSRLKSIGDLDELRYLLRSVDLYLSWHTGRIIIVTPPGQHPHWLSPHDRLVVISQNDLLTSALQNEHYVPPSAWRKVSPPMRATYAPDQIYNDYPLHSALPFISNASRWMILLQDDLLFARPVLACDLFTKPPGIGLRLFSRPLNADSLSKETITEPYDSVYRAHQASTLTFWESVSATASPNRERNSGPSGSYIEPMHAPFLADMDTFNSMWKRWPEEMSLSLSTPFRYPDMLDMIGLHHSEIAQRRQLYRGVVGFPLSWLWPKYWMPLWWWSWPHISFGELEDVASRSQVIDLESREHKELVKEIVVEEGTQHEWRKAVEEMHKGARPLILSLQDGLSKVPSLTHSCLREETLVKMLPQPSQWEDLARPPNRCG